MLTIHYFGEIAEKTGKSSEKWQPSDQWFSVLIKELQEKYALQQGDFQVAVNHKLVGFSEDLKVQESDEIALLSAFAGG